jgi:general secretion pathway protein C
VPAPSTEGLKLHGLLGAGAVIALPDGRQRWVRVGGDVLPGLRLEEVRQNLAVLASSGGRFELSFEGVANRPAPAATAASAPASAAAGPERLREDHLRYRLGFEPRRVDGRITGFAIRRQADLPMLRRAGLQPGDVLVSVNGQSFDSEEKVQELASEIAGSFTAEFEFERDGRRMRRSVEVNPRPQPG